MGTLRIWMNGVEVALWDEGRNGTSRLTYLSEWLGSPQARPLSLSLPLLPDGESHRGAVVSDYFDNLLPDNITIRNRIRDRFATRSSDTFDLLEAIGRDCVGAVQLLPLPRVPESIQQISCRPLTDQGTAELLRQVTGKAFPGSSASDDAFRISIAGAQEKTGLLLHQGRWCIPTGSTPSTHIFKLPLGIVGNMRADMHQSVENEWLCMHLLAAFGIPVAKTQMGQFEDQRALIVERFDRRLAAEGRWWLRLPQEDMCQVFGLPAERKYESDGGPGIVAIMDLLRQSEHPEDRATFFKTQILFWMLAATDGHAKNFSVHLAPGGRFRLTPVYDVLSVHPILGRGPHQLDPRNAQLAMAVQGKNRHRRLHLVRRRHWNETARACGVTAGAEPWIEELIGAVEPAIEQVKRQLPNAFPASVSEPIFKGLRAAAVRLASMAADA
ncbi:type II toxin-antitoxin system HipA family toxin [Stenotrophomonas maltophilia]|uniref:type II toxin-antitoxin system HipA family toxin n=1 Tax=Stenotrophomonas maltophilia TaxID=40324 RepID=UPI0010760387|nr:type II toxin-antitoxin system HipA family toxin [Stenotrophomonas maltophilia]TFZ47902.1 type II toxin-antitoxin system HipA family toxin [Stenotrophomonas maltophilia]